MITPWSSGRPSAPSRARRDGILAPRAAPAARLRADARDRRARRGEDRRAALGAQSGHDREGDRRDRGPGRDRGRHRRARCTTCSPDYKLRGQTGSSARSRSGRAGSRSGARSLGGLIAVVVIVARRRHLDTLRAARRDRARVVLVAQAIGRWGNYFNQELFGRPTTLPWGLEIDLAHRPAGYTQFATFHPTFLYESLWCLARVRHARVGRAARRLRRGQAFALYVAMYTLRSRSGSSACASTPRRRSSASASTCCCRRVLVRRRRSCWFVVARADEPEPRRADGATALDADPDGDAPS